MKFPSEEVIEATISELQSISETHHHNLAAGKPDEADGCEMCQLMKEMNNRGISKGFKPPQVDMLAVNIFDNLPSLEMAMLLGGPETLGVVIALARFCTYLGYRLAKAEVETEKMKEMFGE